MQLTLAIQISPCFGVIIYTEEVKGTKLETGLKTTGHCCKTAKNYCLASYLFCKHLSFPCYTFVEDTDPANTGESGNTLCKDGLEEMQGFVEHCGGSWHGGLRASQDE
jgi:hypothetical protein